MGARNKATIENVSHFLLFIIHFLLFVIIVLLFLSVLFFQNWIGSRNLSRLFRFAHRISGIPPIFPFFKYSCFKLSSEFFYFFIQRGVIRNQPAPFHLSQPNRLL